MSYCVNCGKELGEKDRFFPNCGAAISSGVTVQAGAPRQGRKRRFRRWMLIPLAVLLVGGLVTAAVLSMPSPKQAVQSASEDPQFQSDMARVLTDLCCYSDKYDGSNYTDATAPNMAVKELFTTMEKYIYPGAPEKQLDFMSNFYNSCSALYDWNDAASEKFGLKDMFIDIESLLNRYKNFFGSLPDGIHYSPTADASSGFAPSGASSSKASSSKESSSSAPATGQKMSDSRWDGDPPSGKDKNGMLLY